MYTTNMYLDERGYEPAHIQEVLAEIEQNFAKYFASFWKKPKKRQRSLIEAIEGFEKEQQQYEDFFDLDGLEEYDDDPSAFKGDIKKYCPIIRRCINSREEAMKKYKISFNNSTGQALLETTVNIIQFGREYMKSFDDELHEIAENVADLAVTELLEEEYIAYGVIGGGIKSHFLFCLYPHAFPNRSQNSIWALYFLTGKKNFGFEDESEFLIIDRNSCVTQQNYHYPYDLFCFYALKIFLMLKEACAQKGYSLTNRYRYIYLDEFFDHIANIHQDDIGLLKRSDEYEYFAG